MFLIYGALLLASSRNNLNRGVVYSAFVILTIALFCIMNCNKVPDGDWIWYSAHYLFMRDMSFTDYMGAYFDGIAIKINEPVYYALAYTLSYLSGGDINVLTVTVTGLNYSLVGWAIYRISIAFSGASETKLNPAALAAALLFAITFTLTTQLVRQEIAVALIAAGYSYLVQRRIVVAGIWAALGACTHQSAIFIILVLYGPTIACLLFEGKKRLLVAALVTAVALSAALGHYIANSSIASLGAKDDGSVSSLVVGFDLATFLILVAVTRGNSEIPNFARVLPVSYIAFLVAMLSLVGVPLAMLRLYFYTDILRGVSIVIIMISLSKTVRPSIITAGSILLFVFALIYNETRVIRSPFDYGGSLIQYLLFPFV